MWCLGAATIPSRVGEATGARSSLRVNWINNVVRPKIRSLLTTRREPPDNFWLKCGGCGQMSDRKALEENRFVFPCCGFHARMTAEHRLNSLFDGGEYTVVAVPPVP